MQVEATLKPHPSVKCGWSYQFTLQGSSLRYSGLSGWPFKDGQDWSKFEGWEEGAGGNAEVKESWKLIDMESPGGNERECNGGRGVSLKERRQGWVKVTSSLISPSAPYLYFCYCCFASIIPSAPRPCWEKLGTTSGYLSNCLRILRLGTLAPQFPYLGI